MERVKAFYSNMNVPLIGECRGLIPLFSESLTRFGFELNDRGFNQVGLIMTGMPNLTEVEIEWHMQPFNNNKLVYFATCISKLRQLRVADIVLVWSGTDYVPGSLSPEMVPIKWPSTLFKLKLRFNCLPRHILNDGLITYFTKGGQSLCQLQVVTEFISQCRHPIAADNLHFLRLIFMFSMSQQTVRMSEMLAVGSQLEILSLINIHQVDEHVLLGIQIRCPNLKRLHISSSKQYCYAELTDLQLTFFVRRMAHLTHMHFDDELPRLFFRDLFRLFAKRAIDNPHKFFCLLLNFESSRLGDRGIPIIEEMDKKKDIKNFFFL